ncbi:haloacid dehalogenase-like hydrolase, partial [Caldibacillus thermoamylovorans]|nr:haloacid dehalogenase-like hydrolase [Caldibacillus thermoamylovorans]
MKRILNCLASDFTKMNGKDLKASIEYAAAFGADIILLNMFNVNAPRIMGLEDVPAENLIRKLKELLGRPVGINLEPVDVHQKSARIPQLQSCVGRQPNDKWGR